MSFRLLISKNNGAVQLGWLQLARLRLLFLFLLFLLLFIVPVSVSADIFGATTAKTVTLLGGQFVNFSTGATDAVSGDMKWDNRSGILLAFSTSTTNGFFNATGGGVEGLGPNVDINTTYKVPSINDTTPFGTAFYQSSTFPFFQSGDGVAVRISNGTYAVVIARNITTVSNVVVSITIDYRYNSNGSNLFADAPTTGCAAHSNESTCWNASQNGAACSWDFWLQTCKEMNTFAGFGSSIIAKPIVDCPKFDQNPRCVNITSMCQYSGGLCDPKPNFNWNTGINCSHFNESSLCNNQPHTSPLCTWNVTSVLCLSNTTKVQSDLPTPQFSFCDGASTEAQCTNLTTLYYMPCEWESAKSRCSVVNSAIYGGGMGGDIFDINTQASCQAAGGTWKSDTYSYTNEYGQTKTDSFDWCEFAFGNFGKETCADSCWACEQNGTEAWPTLAAAQLACSNSSVGYCKFYPDSYAPNTFGYCDPDMGVSFGGFKDCSTNCFGCFKNQTCAASANNCTWMSDPFGSNTDGVGSFNASEDGVCMSSTLANKTNCATNCFACVSNATCDASAANGSQCTWNTNFNYCSSNGTVEVCFLPGDEDNDGSYDCADTDCEENMACGFGFEGGGFSAAGLGAIDSYLCTRHDNNLTECNAQNGTGFPLNTTSVCFYHPNPGQMASYPIVGWCDPISDKNSQGDMDFDAPPVMLGFDASGDVNDPWLDVVGFGIHDSSETLDVGMAVKDMTNLVGCNKVHANSTNMSGKYYRYIDVDGNTTNNCASEFNASLTGFEYKFVHEQNGSNHSNQLYYNETINDKKFAYKCSSGTWVPFAAQLNTPVDGCFAPPGAMQEGIGGVDILVIKKNDLGNPKVPLRIYVLTVNSTNASIDSAGPSYYTPGSIDAKFEDCSATGTDNDGDGLDAENDPDCQKFLKLGYIQFEQGPQCADGKDNDGNGYIDCADPSCKYDPFACTQGLTCESTDKTSPQIKWQSVDVLPDYAKVAFDSSEPANGTVLFYKNDSNCLTLNTTVKDPSLLDSFSGNEYSQWHDADLSQNTLNYTLMSNTTYYFKYKMCDLCGNCLISKCTNFTTAATFKAFLFKPTMPNGTTMSIPALNISNDTFAYGKKLNQSQTKNVEIVVNNSNSSYSISFLNCSIMKAYDGNLSNAFVYNITTQSVGMDTDKWQEFSNELGCKYLKMRIPNTGNQLWHCDEDNQTNCYQVTSSVSCSFTSAFTECNIPTGQGLGLSVYQSRTSSSSSSSSSGGGGGGGATAAAAATYNVGDVSSMQSTQTVLARNEKVELTKDSVKHTIELTSVSANSVTLRISSVVQFVTVVYSETKAVDLDQDGENDISIQLTSTDVVANKATLKITSLRAGPVPMREAPAPAKKETQAPVQASVAVPEQVTAPAPSAAQPQQEEAPQQSAQEPVPQAQSASNRLS
ncbi:hypothetical protein HY772_02330 [Candidatus Woesearchaeota archaeon]|nr:hypothetical protein [Candidatus Woesearchaeota archaeon]